MGVLDSVVGNAVNAWNGDGNSVSKTNLQTFLNKFGSSAGKYIDTLDPLTTFDVQFKFFPTVSIAETKDHTRDKLKRVGNSLLNSGKDALMNAADNVTGGLASSVINGRDKESIEKQRDRFKEVHRHTFMEYLAKANLLQVGEQWQDDVTAPLILNLGPYVQSITIPNLKINVNKTGNSMLGEFPTITSPMVHPDGQLQMSILNTRASLHERIFYPWMREVTLPYWSYDSQPYTTATITVDFTKHNDTRYVFCGCRPDSFYVL